MRVERHGEKGGELRAEGEESDSAAVAEEPDGEDDGGVSGEATVGVGVGANALIGGSSRSIVLQPISVSGQEGLNIAVGVAELRLTDTY